MHNRRFVFILLTAVAVLAAIGFERVTIVRAGGIGAQAAPTETPRPRIVTSPSPATTPPTGPSPSPSAKTTTTPTPRPTPFPQTVEQLQTRIRQRMLDLSVRRGRVGIKIVALNTGTTLFENESEKYFIPASNMKNFTVAAALERLTPDFKFVTSVYAAVVPDAAGVVKGDLRIYGRGDVSISTAFNGVMPVGEDDGPAGRPEQNTAYYKGIDRLVDR